MKNNAAATKFMGCKLLLGLVFSGMLLGCSPSGDAIKEVYANYEDAKNAGAISRGWIPDFVPLSATQIYEKYELDSNLQWLRFSFPADEGKNLLKNLSQSRFRPSQFADPEEQWWDVDLEEVPVYLPKEEGAQPSFLAIDWKKRTAYYWTYIRR